MTERPDPAALAAWAETRARGIRANIADDPGAPSRFLRLMAAEAAGLEAVADHLRAPHPAPSEEDALDAWAKATGAYIPWSRGYWPEDKEAARKGIRAVLALSPRSASSETDEPGLPKPPRRQGVF